MFKNRLKIVKPDSGGEASPAPERPSRSDEPPSPYHLDNITEGSKSVSLLPL
jgi:hypothetical protein